jgi:hypothetical protein
MEMFDGVGRRRDQTQGQLVSIGERTLNGYERNMLFHNNGDGTFTDVGYVERIDRIEDARGLAVLDYDADGHLDVVLRNYKQPARLLRNSGREHWLRLKLVGTRSNRDAVGARIVLQANGLRQMREVRAGSGYLSGSSLIQHFGLETATRVDEIRVRWPSGAQTLLRNVAPNRTLVLREGAAVAEVGRDALRR